MWKTLLNIVVSLFAAILVFAAGVELYSGWQYSHIAGIEVVGIGRDKVTLSLPLKPAKGLEHPSGAKIELYAKEGPFWIETDDSFSDLRIASCRNTSFAVIYSRFDVPDRTKKETLLQFLRGIRKVRQESAADDCGMLEESR